MKTIKEIYEEYKIMPQLQEHQLRVAAVAKQVCESMKESVDTDNIIKTCLLHDMGNIIKFNLNVFPEFRQEKGIEYWQAVKDEFIERYGNDEHHATMKIAQEIGVDSKILHLLSNIGFSKAILNAKSSSLEGKICVYADMRVGPYGVLTLSERLEEGAKRYVGTKKWIINNVIYKQIVKSIYLIEKQIFAQSDITPDQIIDESIAKSIKALSNMII